MSNKNEMKKKEILESREWHSSKYLNKKKLLYDMKHTLEFLMSQLNGGVSGSI